MFSIGEIVTLVKDAEQVPAMVVKLYEDVHGDIVADVAALTATHTAVPTAAPEDPAALHIVSGTPAPPATPAPTADTAAETADKATIADLQAQLDAANAKLAADEEGQPTA